ncbi:MAG: acyloxyacyl hydrolase [Calditrichia bacterium]
MKKLWILIVLLLTILSPQEWAQQPYLASIGYTSIGVLDNSKLTATRIELRSNFTIYQLSEKMFVVTPMAGLLVINDGGEYLYAGINLNNVIAHRIIITPNFAVGSFFEGRELNLGGVLEFRSGIEVGVMLSGKIILSGAFHHISNAALYDFNPGTETMTMAVSMGI